MKRVRTRLKELTDPRRNGVKDVRLIIRDLNPVLRGWGNYFRTGNAARKFKQLDRYVARRLKRFMVRRYGRHLKPRQARPWKREWFEGHGLYRMRGTVRYPKQCMLRSEPLSLSRVRGAVCNGVDHAGESPAAAVARFGCVATPDIGRG